MYIPIGTEEEGYTYLDIIDLFRYRDSLDDRLMEIHEQIRQVEHEIEEARKVMWLRKSESLTNFPELTERK